uniref:histidine kinase n=1 Tax=Rhodopseudomonas palustris (strain DX-1) TaxID=652103 RepID=E6VPL8_RHOPX
MVRLGFIIGLIAIVGVVLSGFSASRVYEQEAAIQRIALGRAIDVHASQVQDRLTERELLGRVASGLFRKPSVIKADMLQPLRSSIYTFKTDFVLATWVARLKPEEVPAAEAELTRAGFPEPTVRDYDGQPLDLTRDPVLDVVMDVEPRNPETMALTGRMLDHDPILGRTFARALAEGQPHVSDPLPLTGNGPIGVVLAAPVMNTDSSDIVGFVTFSYNLATLMLTNDDLSLFSVVLKDPSRAGYELVADESGQISSRAHPEGFHPFIMRTVTFGNRDWSLAYYPKIDPYDRAQKMALIIGLAGLALTLIVCGLFGYVSYSNIRLRREIQMRIGFERRLTAVIDELNHRVKNILAVIQSIVTRTLRHGSDLDVARELLIGRIHAMSNVVSLLSDSQWQGVMLKGLFEGRAIPHADRIEVDGPDIAVSARAAQSLSLLFFELASHSDEGLAVVGKHPSVVASWSVTGEGKDATFYFRWEEFNTSAATRRPDSEFGIILLDRVAPEALGGTSKRYFTDVSYVYELTAPLETVVDVNERARTGQITASVRPVRKPRHP